MKDPGAGDAKAVKPLRLLIVERDDDTLEMMSMLMRHSGFLTSTVTSGKAALQVAAEYNPDVIITGMKLSDCGGHELAARLRAQPSTAHYVLIALTGRGVIDGDPIFALFDHVMQKPVFIERLVEILLRCMEHSAE